MLDASALASPRFPQLLASVIVALALVPMAAVGTADAKTHHSTSHGCPLVLKQRQHGHSGTYYKLETCAKRVLVLTRREHGHRGSYYLYESWQWSVRH